MAKEIFKRDLVLIDFNKDVFKFYNIEVLSVGYNELQFITHQGKLGNNGKQLIQRTSEFKVAMQLADDKFREKKREGYVEVELIKALLGQSTPTSKTKKEQPPKEKKDCFCGTCNKPIPSDIYAKINEWGRKEAGWDKDINFIGYQKVLCMTCQFKYDIYKKKM